MKFGPLELSTADRKHNFLPLGIMVIIMMSVLGVILARLTILTVFRGQELRRRADENRILIRKIPAPRGIIFDRNGKALTRNAPEGRIYPFSRNFPHVIGYVGEVSREELEACQSLGYQFSVFGYQSKVNQLSVNQSETDRPKTDKPGTENREQKTDNRLLCNLQSGDVIGKTGLEKQYDKILRGTDGAELIEVDANGNLLGVLEDQLPQAGKDIHTYLDVDLQIAMTESLRDRRGAAVAIDPVDGSILGLASSPAYDPGVFVQANSKWESRSEKLDSDVRSEKSHLTLQSEASPASHISSLTSIKSSVQDLLNDTANMPLFNRAISGEYPPGSIFKLVTASAGLSENKITRQTLVTDTGEIRIGEFRFGNWYFDQYGKTEGEIGVARALARSNDIFFYKIGEWLGPDLLADWAVKMGLGKKTGIDLSGEADGLIPNPKWKEKNTGDRWFLGNTYHMAIGQGDVQLTPLQAVMMAGAAVTGKLCTPRIGLSDSQINGLSDDQICKDTGVSDSNRNLILEGMTGACSSGGTAFPFFPWNQNRLSPSAPDGASGDALPAVGCKTGTAQHGGKQTKPHAWITVTGPIVKEEGKGKKEEGLYKLDLESSKRIVLVVMLEEAGEGSYEAAPAAKNILERWFKEQ